MIPPGIFAAQASTLRTPVTREYFAASFPGELTGSDEATWHTLVTLNPVLGAGNWLCFWSCEIQVGGINALGTAVARIAIANTLVDQTSYTAVDFDDWQITGGMLIVSGAGDAGLTLDFRRGSDLFTTDPPKARNGRIILLKLGADDKFVEDVALQTNSSASPADGATLNFTPGSSGDYLVIGYGQVGGAITAKPVVNLSDGVNASPDMRVPLAGSGERHPVFRAWLRAGLSGAQSLSFQFSTNGAQASLWGARVVALRMDGFSHVFVEALAGDDSGTDSTFTDGLTLTRTVQDKDYLSFAAWGISNPSGEALESRFNDALGPVNTQAQHSLLPDPIGNSGFSARLAAYAAGRKNWSVQRKAPPTKVATIKAGAVIALLQLN